MYIKNQTFFILTFFITLILLCSCLPSNQNKEAALSLTQTAFAAGRHTPTANETYKPDKPLGAQQTEVAAIQTERVKITQRLIATQMEEAANATQQALKYAATEISSQQQKEQAAQQLDLLTNLVWKATFEKGNLSEFQGHGDFISQGSSGMYYFITQAFRGNYSIALSIDTTAPSDTGAHAAYLFIWDQLMLKGDYYYSAWYYIPGNIITKSWWNIWQWKSTEDGNSSNSKPIFSIDCSTSTQPKHLTLYYRPDLDDLSIKKYFISPKPFPTDSWVHLEAYYKRSTGNDGEVIVWQNEEEIFHITGFPTILSDGTLYWSVNHYTDSIEPNPSAIYLDDLAISKTRVGEAMLP